MINNSLIKELEGLIGQANVLTDEVDLYSYSYDGAVEMPVSPDIVLVPEKTEDLGRIIKLLNEEKIPTIIRGAGSNLSGGTIPIKKGAVIVTTK